MHGAHGADTAGRSAQICRAQRFDLEPRKTDLVATATTILIVELGFLARESGLYSHIKSD
jgi:hypothetical protein